MQSLLDSNVLSELWKPRPEPAVLAWINNAEWFVPVPVIAEIQEGAEAAASEAVRIAITRRLDSFLENHPFAILSWDAETSRVWARLRHSPEVKRRPQALWDSLIDAMGVRHSATIATRNTKDFRHSKTLNPWFD